jgi:hypothetical protein
MSNITDTTPHSETAPALVDPPQHPVTNPCSGCPRWRRTNDIVITDSTIYWHNFNIGATIGERRVVAALVEARGEYVEYRTLYDKLKGIPGFCAGYGDDGFKTNVRSMVKRARKKFLFVDPKFDRIANMQAYGYAWK